MFAQVRQLSPEEREKLEELLAAENEAKFFATPEIEAWVHTVLLPLRHSQASQIGEATLVSVTPDAEGFLMTQEVRLTDRGAQL